MGSTVAGITEEQAAQAREAVKACNGNKTAAANKLGIPRTTLRRWLEADPASESQESWSYEAGTNTAVISAKSRTIRTLEAALKEANTDLSVWEVDRHKINKWDGFAKVDSRRDKWGSQHKLATVELWQVKVWLRRKSPVTTSLEALLAKISENATLLPAPRRPRPKRAPQRCLEVCVMDPHLGLLCQQPEADAEWDLDLAAQTVLEAMDTLIERAGAFGPFEQAVMPFGNDFVHCDTVFHTTTAGTGQPEAIDWHRVYVAAEALAIEMVKRLRRVAKVFVYQIPGNHSRQTDFTLARLLQAYFRSDRDVVVDASSSPYKFHRYGANFWGYDHGHSVTPIRMAGLMANERPRDWAETHYREWHLGDQHRKGSADFEEQGVSVEYIPGLTAPNAWHRIKSFNHQKRGAMAYVWDHSAGPIARLQYNISPQTHKAMR